LSKNNDNEIAKVRVPVDDNVLMLSDRWQDWITVFGYLTFAVFIAWRVLTPR